MTNALVLTVGGSPEPLEFCINNYEHDLIYFIHSKDSKKDAEFIIANLNIPEDQYRLKLLNDHESLEDAFLTAREVIKELKKEFSNVHVDFTGGTKPMVSGLVLAAIGDDCSYTYVGTEEQRTKNNTGIVQSGFEMLKEQRDPYDLFAVMEFERGKDFFDKYQFQAARTNFEEAYKKLESENLKAFSKIYIDLVDLYDCWDKFNNKVNGITLNSFLSSEIMESIGPIFDELNGDYPEFITKLKDNLDFLELKISRKGSIKPKNVKYYIADILNNAYRRIEEGKYDDAVARLYRSIELIAQFSLTELNLIDENILRINKEFKISKRKIEELNNPKAIEFLYRCYEFTINNKDSFGLPLKKSYELLDALGQPFASKYLNDKSVKSKVNLRNGSILAHGLHDINENQAGELYEQVLDYAKIVFEDVEEYMEMAKFPKFGSKQ